MRAAGRIVATVAFLALLGCRGQPLAPAAGGASPPPALVSSIELEDASRARRIALRVAYPARGRSLPVVIFSHGAYSSKDDYAPITDGWAARGYVVIAITHLDSVTLGAVRGRPTPGAWGQRIADLRYTMDHLDALAAAIEPLRGRIDTTRIAVAGHSLGALVAQAFGGMSGTDPETHQPYALAEPRVRAVIALSGVGPLPPLTRAEDFRGLRTPLFVSVGTLDLAMPQLAGKSGFELRREPFELAPAGHKYLLVLRGSDHYLGGMVGRDDLPRSPDGPLYVETFTQLSGLFLDAWLKGDAAARRRLDALPVPAASAAVASLSRG